MTEISEQKQQLEKLLLSEDLEELNLKTRQFNIFNALKLQNAEIRHSNFLGWLMAPYETHELGDYFLKEFLKSAIKDFSQDCNTELCLSDIALMNFSNAEIKREYKNIDILVIDNDNKFVCVVENKTWTTEHDNQLLRYAQIVDNEFKDYKKLFIFLTPPNSIDSFNELIERNDSVDNAEHYYYVPMSYEQVFNAIDKTLKFNEKHLNSDVKIFIEHYKNMIERNIMGEKDKAIVDLCRKIYRYNKNAIDLIVESVGCAQKDIDKILTQVIEEDSTLTLEPCGKGWIRFTSKSVDFSKLSFAKDDWVKSDKIIMIEINNNEREKVSADLIIRCAEDNDERYKKIIDTAKDMFNYNAKTTGYAHVFSTSLVSSDEYYALLSCENIKEVLKNRLLESGIIEKFNKFAEKITEKL